MSIFNYLLIFLYFYIFFYTAHICPTGVYLSPLILLERNAAVAIIKVGLTAASESGGQKGNKTSEIRGQSPGAKVK